MDSSSNMEEHNLRVSILCTHSIAGAFPLGIMICSDERTTTLVKGINFLKNCFPDDAFYGRGREVGPGVIMTDNSDELREALNLVWPSTKLILCIFHKFGADCTTKIIPFV